MRRRWMTAVMAGVLAVGMTACASSERGAGGDAAGGTFVFGAAGAPKNFDPIFNDDGESFRPARQMFDTLITYKPGTTELEPGLATEWTSTPDGKTWTFTLREGVTFHDGTPLDATAVCANFDRWFTMKGAAAQSQMIYYGDVFEGFAKNEGDASGAPLYKSCTAQSPNTAVLALNEFKGAFPAAFGLTSFSISSPAALEQYDADAVTQSGDSFTYPAYANEHPTGTGPFKFESFDKANNTITLVRNDQYWGEKAKVDRLIFKVIPDENARKQELQAGTIDGYDYPNAADWESLRTEGYNVLVRPVFNILYLGINQKNKALADVNVRQAIAHAIDKEAVAKSSLPEGSVTAKQFMPNLVEGYNDAIEDPAYDVDEAKRLLKDAGQENLELKFAYPTGVSRPYMPSPEDTFAVIKSQLEKAGFKITPVAAKWTPDYLDMIQSPGGTGKHDIHLLGWTGDYNDPDNFIGVFFGGKSAEWGFDNPALFKALADARELPTREAQIPAYEKINAQIAEFVPGIPLAHPAPSLAFAKGVQGYVASPVQDEVWNNVTVTR
jgi:peptide/nickel transport system substrate-binding protein